MEICQWGHISDMARCLLRVRYARQSGHRSESRNGDGLGALTRLEICDSREARGWSTLCKFHYQFFLRQFGMPRLKYLRLAHSGSHGFLTCFPLGCLVVSNRFTACCVNRIERDSRMIAA